MSRDGYVELERAIASIHVGARHRTDLGDLDALVASIEHLGLLQPITITPDGILVCGARRLAAVTRLGWHTVRVWIRSGISTRAEALLAERDENTVREALRPSDAATLYTELRQLLADEAAVRKTQTQFARPAEQGYYDDQDDVAHTNSGPAESAGPEQTPPASGETRRQAAQLVTGQASYDRLDQAAEVHHLAHDPQTPEEVRNVAQRELTAMDTDGKVRGHHAVVRAADFRVRLRDLANDQNQPTEVRHQAAAAAERLADPTALPTSQLVRENRRARGLLDAATPATSPVSNGEQVSPVSVASTPDDRGLTDPGSRSSGSSRRAVRAFILLWDELAGWVTNYDPTLIGQQLDAEHWQSFCNTVQQTQEFLARAAEARRGAGHEQSSAEQPDPESDRTTAA